MKDINDPIKTCHSVKSPLYYQIPFSGQEKSKWFVNDRALNAVGLDGDIFVKKLALKGKIGAGRLIYPFSCLWEDT